MASNRPAKGGIVDDKTRLELYRVMVLSRTYEEAILREYHADKKPAFDIGAGLVPGEMHLSAGQEPAAAGVCAHLRRDDAVTATHRPHHIAIAHGVDLDRMTAEIFGRETGLGRGRGGHMHLFDPQTHFSCSGIVAEGLPPATGQAFAFQRQGSGRVAVAFTGEGATLIEVHTVRLWGHFEGDAQGYRPDLADVPGCDPIPAYEARLTDAGILNAGLVRSIKEEAVARVEKVIEFAKSSPVPAPQTALEYVFA